MVMAFSASAKDSIEEIKGSTGSSDQGFLKQFLASKERQEEGKLLKEAVNQGIGAFVPDDLFENLVNNFSNAERLYGQTFLNLVSGYDFNYLKRNIKIPEFQRELKRKIENMVGSIEHHAAYCTQGNLVA